mmetsp:Transcript_52882/g.155790  ORF Transcript_52882/g.155790 Transcript_52882/m.155790 type:complete len:206 (-) Transcript_52882:1462-2079(-)
MRAASCGGDAAGLAFTLAAGKAPCEGTATRTLRATGAGPPADGVRTIAEADRPSWGAVAGVPGVAVGTEVLPVPEVGTAGVPGVAVGTEVLPEPGTQDGSCDEGAFLASGDLIMLVTVTTLCAVTLVGERIPPRSGDAAKLTPGGHLVRGVWSVMPCRLGDHDCSRGSREADRLGVITRHAAGGEALPGKGGACRATTGTPESSR